MNLSTKLEGKFQCGTLCSKRTLLISRFSILCCLCVMALCGNVTTAAEISGKHSLSARYQKFDDTTFITQSFSYSGLAYRYQFSRRIGLDLEVYSLSGDRKGNLIRLGFSGAVPLGRLHVNYGGNYYWQELDNLAVDPEDSGFKLMAGLGFEIRRVSLDLNYFSDDVAGAHPDDPGDYVEVARFELDVAYSLSNSPWSFEYKYVNASSDYSAYALAVKYHFRVRSPD